VLDIYEACFKIRNWRASCFTLKRITYIKSCWLTTYSPVAQN
jgi:hypothetical protein